MNKIIAAFITLLLIGLIGVSCRQADESEIQPEKVPISSPEENLFPENQIYGITIDDGWYESIQLSQIINAIQDMPVKPTVRIVMSRDIHPIQYLDMFKKVKEVAYVMATPVDSYDMIYYEDAQSYLKRFEESYGALSDYVDLWEIGNEVNGEGWLGDNVELIAEKIISVYEMLEEKQQKTVLTAYYTAPGMQKMEMETWLSNYIPKSVKSGLDYLFISYYEDDNEGYQPDWQGIFLSLEKEFPHSKLGIGECGSTNHLATLTEKVEKANHYYSMPQYNSQYVGGYFWWYWVEDCVPHERNSLYDAINSAIQSKQTLIS